MQTYLVDMLQCPVCYGGLIWKVAQGDVRRIEVGEAGCEDCGATYPVREGIGLFLTPDLPRNDLWDGVESGLIRYLRENPELESDLMDVLPERLGAADRFFRMLVSESRGDYGASQELAGMVNEGLYTEEYLRCWESQVDYVVDMLTRVDGPVVDLASGRGYLVEVMIDRLDCAVVVTDFSPTVLRRNRAWLKQLGVYERVSLLAFDARRTPFKDGVVPVLTTNLGLPNIELPGEMLRELRRISGGMFLAISHFYSEGDVENGAVIEAAGLTETLYKGRTLANYEVAGWRVSVENGCVGVAEPTPVGAVLAGVRVDGLPVAETELEWCVLRGT